MTFEGTLFNPVYSLTSQLLWQPQTLSSKSSKPLRQQISIHVLGTPYITEKACPQAKRKQHTYTQKPNQTNKNLESHKHCSLHPKIKSPPEFACFI